MKPKKTSGWLQGLYEISSTAKEMVGTLREDLWGNKYRYGQAGATALAAGKLAVAADMDTDVENCAVSAAAAVGSKTVSLTVTSTTIAEDKFRGGFLVINDAAGEGHRYTILHSTAVAAGTAITVTLDDPIQVALTTSSEGTLMESAWKGAVISATDQADLPIGIPMVAITAEYYGWFQTAGEAVCLADEAASKGAALTIGSSVAGSLEAVDAAGEPQIAIAREALTDTEYYPVMLCIE